MPETTVPERPYLSIGEVLGLLLDEFPDVTISKIRFLESQGLIDPERTPSGYRKFYDADVERLRVILREQRENFLPLRVIRDRLESGAIDSDPSGPITPPRGIRNVVGNDAAAPATTRPLTSVGLAEQQRGAAADDAHHDVHDDPHDDGDDSSGYERPAIVPSSNHPAAQIRLAPAPSTGTRRPVSETYSAAELCAEAGLDDAQLAELESFGLLSGQGSGRATVYSGAEVAIAKAAAGFLAHGVQGRHLRAWRQAGDREAALFEQIVLPLMRQRNPQARQQAQHTLRSLAELGGDLRAAIVHAALRQHLDP